MTRFRPGTIVRPGLHLVEEFRASAGNGEVMTLKLSRRAKALVAAIGSVAVLGVMAFASGAGTAGPNHLVNKLRPLHSAAAFVHGEKDKGLEATGPAQEAYDNRAYQRHYIAPTRTNTARTDFTSLPRSNAAAAHAPAAPNDNAWTEVGPLNPRDPDLLAYGGALRTISGRALALLVKPGCTRQACRVWVGTAGGGIWRTDNGLGPAGSQAWTPVNNGLTSNAVSSLSLVDGVLYAGTGEPDGSNDSEAGTGLFASSNGGNTWSLVPGSAALAQDRALSGLYVAPGSNGKHIIIGTAAARHGASAVWGGRAFPPGAPALGIYETTDGGAHWSAQQLPTVSDGAFLGGVTKVLADPRGNGNIYASVFGYGLFRRTAGGGSWTLIYQSISYGQPGAGIGGGRVEFDLAALNTSAGNRLRIYLGDSDTLGDSIFLRTDNGDSASPTAGWIKRTEPQTANAYCQHCETARRAVAYDTSLPARLVTPMSSTSAGP